MNGFPHAALVRLAQRILRGEALFFVGAGFSLDCENNTAARLIARLLARFLALSEQSLRGSEWRNNLCNTFTLGIANNSEEILTAEIVTKLSNQYFPINDWMCSAFSLMLTALHEFSKDDGHSLFTKADYREEELLAGLNQRHSERQDLSLPFPHSKIPIAELLQIDSPTDRGKALFLETLGFADPRVMGGDPFTSSPRDVEASYYGRLLKRHHVLARLSREGLCPVLLTTNYDLLLEGAFRLSGFSPRSPNEADSVTTESFLPVAYSSFTRIADGLQFYDHGFGHQSALVVKIHGCAGDYRRRREETKSWCAYLPSVVFTYREIQNWREDSWSRDFVRTLLRTRTVVFCGYSATDQVIHDTFRTVYEEMALKRKRNESSTKSDPSSPRRDEHAPAFFLGREIQPAFHGMEILRAASRVAGVENPSLDDHPNYLRFSTALDGFPVLDEILLWLGHLVFRLKQREALERDVRHIASSLLDRPIGEHEIEIINQHFRELIEAEGNAIKAWRSHYIARSSLHRIVGWTERFHAGFLRELACSEAILRNQGLPFEPQSLAE